MLSLLVTASPYFAAALNGKFAESSEKSLRLPGVTGPVFQQMLHWICQAELVDELSDPSEWQVMLVQLWFVADMCMMPALANEPAMILDAGIGHERVEVETVSEIWKLAPADSNWRRYIVNELRVDLDGDSHMTEELDILGRLPGFVGSLTHCTRAHGSNPDIDVEWSLPTLKEDL